MGKRYTSLHIDDLANELYKAVGTFGESQSDVIIKVCSHYLKTAHRDINDKYDGQGKEKLAKILLKFKGGSHWLNTQQ